VNQRRHAHVVLAASGALTLAGSLLPFYEIAGSTTNAWGRGLFPLMTLPALVGATFGTLAGLGLAGRWRPPERLAGLAWPSFATLVSGLTLALMLGLLAGAPGATFRPLASVNAPIDTSSAITRGAGFWTMTAGAAGLLAGAALERPRRRLKGI
jgi:hypothetical protein